MRRSYLAILISSFTVVAWLSYAVLVFSTDRQRLPGGEFGELYGPLAWLRDGWFWVSLVVSASSIVSLPILLRRQTPGYDPRDEYPVLEKLKAAGWISRFWADRQDLHAEWTDVGRQRMRNWREHADELSLESDNQAKVMDFYSHYLISHSV